MYNRNERHISHQCGACYRNYLSASSTTLLLTRGRPTGVVVDVVGETAADGGSAGLRGHLGHFAIAETVGEGRIGALLTNQLSRKGCCLRCLAEIEGDVLLNFARGG